MRISAIQKARETVALGINHTVPIQLELAEEVLRLYNQLKIAKAALEFYAECGCENNDGFTNKTRAYCDPEEHCHECNARQALEQLK